MHVYWSAPGSYKLNPKANFEIQANETFKNIMNWLNTKRIQIGSSLSVDED
jgi:hypothetical protein